MNSSETEYKKFTNMVWDSSQKNFKKRFPVEGTQSWYSGNTQRERAGREVGVVFRMGGTHVEL